MKLYRRSVAGRTVRAHLVVVSMPSLAFCTRLVEAQEPVGVQALRPELADERFDERVVGRSAWPAEVERHILHVCPEVELLADELGTVIDADRLGIKTFEVHGSKSLGFCAGTRGDEDGQSVPQPGVPGAGGRYFAVRRAGWPRRSVRPKHKARSLVSPLRSCALPEPKRQIRWEKPVTCFTRSNL